MDSKNTKAPEPKKSIKECKYNEICSKAKLCGDCGLDEYERQQYEEAVENFKIDRKMR